LGYDPQHSLADGLTEAMKWYWDYFNNESARP